jgi:hypothetical protein
MRNRTWNFLCIGTMLGLTATPVPASHLYQGWGSATHGGEEHPIVQVTTLADSRTGSLRTALTVS